MITKTELEQIKELTKLLEPNHVDIPRLVEALERAIDVIRVTAYESDHEGVCDGWNSKGTAPFAWAKCDCMVNAAREFLKQFEGEGQ